jgi:hypothetical protein
MRETLAENSLLMSKLSFRQSKRLHLGNIPTTHMLEFTSLEQFPHTFLRPPSGSTVKNELIENRLKKKSFTIRGCEITWG